jgi:hypothetical protein
MRLNQALEGTVIQSHTVNVHYEVTDSRSSGKLTVNMDEVVKGGESQFVPTKIKMTDYDQKSVVEKKAQIRAALLLADASGATYVQIKSGMSAEKNRLFFSVFNELKNTGLLKSIQQPLMDKNSREINEDGTVKEQRAGFFQRRKVTQPNDQSHRAAFQPR